jgi:hypothetical protein
LTTRVTLTSATCKHEKDSFENRDFKKREQAENIDASLAVGGVVVEADDDAVDKDEISLTGDAIII